MTIEINTDLLEIPARINMNQLVFLSMVLDKNQKTYNQNVHKLVSLISDEDISYLIEQQLIASIERGNYTIYEPTEKLLELIKPNQSLFDLFYNEYPVYVVRPDGGKSFLRANINKCRKIYNTLVGKSTAMAEHINRCLKFEIDKRMRDGSMCFMKTMQKWLQDNQWEVVEEEMRNSNNTNMNAYGTEII